MSAVARRYFVRASEELRRGDLESARDNFRAALELAPMFVEARIGYATALVRTREAGRAAQVLRDGLDDEKRPQSRLVLESALGEVLITLSDYRGAEQAFSSVAQASEALGLPANASLHDRLARLRAKTGRFREALDELLVAARGRRAG